jgi:hypothetical protein
MTRTAPTIVQRLFIRNVVFILTPPSKDYVNFYYIVDSCIFTFLSLGFYKYVRLPDMVFGTVGEKTPSLQVGEGVLEFWSIRV